MRRVNLPTPAGNDILLQKATKERQTSERRQPTLQLCIEPLLSKPPFENFNPATGGVFFAQQSLQIVIISFSIYGTGVFGMAEKHSSKGIMWATIGIAVVLIAIIYPLTNKSFNSAATSGAGSDDADIRIQPVAKFELAKAEAPVASGPRDGATIYNTVCGACHNSGAAGAPKIDDKGAWAPRLAQGKDALIKSVTNGKGAMPAKGGAVLSDEEIKSVVEYVMGKAK